MFLTDSAAYLREYLPRLKTAVDVLRCAKGAEAGKQHTDGDALWWRPHENCNSAGNLLLHLEGNVRQWILHGLGGAADDRGRSAEFSERDGADPWPALEKTARAACRVIDEFPRDRLDEPLEIQGFSTTPLRAIYHVVEHFSWHAGQIVWIAKARGGPEHGIAFYDDAALE